MSRQIPILALLLLCLTGSVLAQAVSDPQQALTVVPPKGWSHDTDGNALVLYPSNESASLVLMAREAIPLQDKARMSEIVGSLATDGWKVTRETSTTVQGVPALKIEVDGVSGDVAQDQGFFFLISDGQRGWMACGMATKKEAGRILPNLESTVRAMKLAQK